MAIISFIKRSLLWWAALMFFRHVHTEECEKYIFIADVNSSLVNPTNITQACNVSQILWYTRKPLFVNAPKQGHCSTETCSYINVTKLTGGYEIILKEHVDGIILHFLQNAMSLISGNISAVCLNYTSISVNDLCANGLRLNQSACPGNSSYILYDQQNGSMTCSSCPSPHTSPSSYPPSSSPTSPSSYPPSSSPTSPSSQPPSSTTKNTNKTISIPTNGKPYTLAAVEVMNNLSSLVQSMVNESSASITMGKATGFLYKQAVEADVSLGYNQEMEWEQVDPSQGFQLMWSVKVPAEAIKMSHSKDNGTPFVGVLRFPELPLKVDSGLTFASDIFGISMGVNITNLTDTIDICFRNISKNGPNMTCSSWGGTGNWTTSGCSTNEVNNTVTCSCTHLTFFAILMSEPGQNISAGDKTTLTYITIIGCGLSTFFLLVGLFIHLVMWRSKSRLGTTILMNLFVALILLNITFLSNQQVWSQHNTGCIVIAAAMHFSMLATFTWFFMQGLHFYLILSAVNMKIRKYKLSFIGSGWGFPAVVAIVIASSGNYESVDYVEMCWITNKYIHYIVNVGYYSVIFVFTSVVFIMIIRKIIQSKQSIIKTSSKKTGAIFGLYVLLGLTWGVAFFSYGALTVPSYYIFTILNSFQGFFLFLYYYYFRNDEPEISQSASTTAPSLKKPDNVSSTETSGLDTVTEYN